MRRRRRARRATSCCRRWVTATTATAERSGALSERCVRALTIGGSAPAPIRSPPVKVVVFGATGVVGRAAVEHFATVADEVIGVSRRPVDVARVTHVALDLTDELDDAASSASPVFAGTTHVVYAALQESPDLVSGWRDPELMDRNLRMFHRALAPLLAAHGDSLEHVSLLQGAKAYGLHVGKSPIPAKERS